MDDMLEAMQKQSFPLSVRLGPEELETLDRLVVAVRAYYKGEARNFAPAARLAEDVTRSSALRDLLLAWKLGCSDQFDPNITKKVND